MTVDPRAWLGSGRTPEGFPGGSAVKSPPASEGDVGLIPQWERYPGGWTGNPLLYSCLENSMDRGACGLQSMGLQRVRHNWAHTSFLMQMRKLRFRERKWASLIILSSSTYLPLIYHVPSKLGLRSSDLNSEASQVALYAAFLVFEKLQTSIAVK